MLLCSRCEILRPCQTVVKVECEGKEERVCMACFRPGVAAIRRVAARFKDMHERNPDAEVDMSTGTINRYFLRFEALCGTVACHAGYYFLSTLEEIEECGGVHDWAFELPDFPCDNPKRPRVLRDTQTHTDASYHRGSYAMARDLGLETDLQLMEWARRNAHLWGCEGGDMMFGSRHAFGRTPEQDMNLLDFYSWWAAVADRVEKEGLTVVEIAERSREQHLAKILW